MTPIPFEVFIDVMEELERLEEERNEACKKYELSKSKCDFEIYLSKAKLWKTILMSIEKQY